MNNANHPIYEAARHVADYYGVPVGFVLYSRKSHHKGARIRHVFWAYAAEVFSVGTSEIARLTKFAVCTVSTARHDLGRQGNKDLAALKERAA